MFDISSATVYSLGYLGIFALSIVANLIVFIPVPYLLLIMFAALSGRFDLALLVISGSIGGTIGKMIVFQSFYSGSRLVKSDARKNLEAFRTVFEKYAWFAVFIAAATPVPDDIVYVPLGLARYNRFRFFLALLAGKTIITMIVVYGALFLTKTVLGTLFLGGEEASTVDLIIAGVVFAVIALLVTLLISRINWNEWIEKHFQDGKKRG